MKDLPKDEQDLLKGYRQGKQWKGELEALKAEDPFVDEEDLLTYMNATGVDSPRKAYAKINDLDSGDSPEPKEEKPTAQITNFHELQEKAHEYMEQRREANKDIPSTEVTGITDSEELQTKMREFLDERSQERGQSGGH